MISVFMATCNKNEALRNTLYALSIQEVSELWEVCIVDDGSEVDPVDIIKEMLPTAKYLRLEQPVGFIYSHARCFDLMSPDTDKIVLMSCDVICSAKDSIEQLCKRVSSKNVVISEVVDVEVSPLMFTHYSRDILDIMTEWEVLRSVRYNLVLGGSTYSCSAQYSGYANHALFFLGAITRNDLETTGFRNGGCDVMLNEMVKRTGCRINIAHDIRGVHQRHPKTTPLCPLETTCCWSCIRKSPEYILWKSHRGGIA